MPARALPPDLLLDGGMGATLLERGLPWDALPERWLLERPAEVARVHAEHAAAGAGLVLTCTFNLASDRLARAGLDADVPLLARRAVEVARAAAPGALVAGAVGPTGLVRPGAPPSSAGALAAGYHRAGEALAAAGADLLWVESQWDLGEALAALAALRATGLPAAATLSPAAAEGGELRLAGGEGAAPALAALAAAGACAVGVNCVLPGAPLAAALRAAGRLGVPLVAKPSPGMPGRRLAPEAFAAWLAELADAGARWLGGCCGAGPEHLAATAARLGRRRPTSPDAA